MRRRVPDARLSVCTACGNEVRLLVEGSGIQRLVDTGDSSDCPSDKAIFHTVPYEQVPLVRSNKHAVFLEGLVEKPMNKPACRARCTLSEDYERYRPTVPNASHDHNDPSVAASEADLASRCRSTATGAEAAATERDRAASQAQPLVTPITEWGQVAWP